MEKKGYESDELELLWNYFALHSNQRIQLLNFYILIESFLITALITLFVQSGTSYLIFNLLICVSVIFFSFIFYAIDYRTKTLIKLSEDAIRLYEITYVPHDTFRIFKNEYTSTNEIRKSKMLNLLSYSKLFFLVYIYFTVIGLIGIILSLMI